MDKRQERKINKDKNYPTVDQQARRSPLTLLILVLLLWKKKMNSVVITTEEENVSLPSLFYPLSRLL